MSYEKISLTGGDCFVTKNNIDAYKVVSGDVLIYVVPYSNESIGRRSYIYEAHEQEVIPSFYYKDMNYQEWRFCFVALDNALLECIEQGSTKVLKEKFCKKAKIHNFGIEGYEESLVDQYRRNIITEDGFIRRTQNERHETTQKTIELIVGAFKKSKFYIDEEQTKDHLYNCVRILCNKSFIPIASYEKIKEACGENAEISDIARLSHFSYREVLLSNDWYKNDSGAFLVFLEKNKKPLVCLPNKFGAYMLYDDEDGSLTPVTKKVAQSIAAKAFMFYRPLKTGKLSSKEIVRYCVKSIKAKDIILLAIMTVTTSLIGLLTPMLSQSIYDEYIPMGAKLILLQFGCLMTSFMIGNIMFSIVKNLINFRLTSKMSYDFQGAIYDRLFNLPESFFRKYESADLAQRAMGATSVVNSYTSSFFSIIIGTVFVSIYLIRMAIYSPKLTIISILMIIIYLAIYYFIFIASLKYERVGAELEGKTNSMMFQFLLGISKIRIAGVEDRALYEYLKPYVKLRNNEAKKENIVDIVSVISLVSNSIFSIILYVVIVKGNLDVSFGSFIAFNSVFGMFTAYAIQIMQSIVGIKTLKPTVERLKPILEEEPEFDEAKELPGEITGNIEINNVSFSYDKDSPNVLSNISLNIKAGEYVGIVGPSGCGKSTLLKLLLGFEKTDSGKIYYDNKDIDGVDKRELRKKIGVVLQDGKLISGSIFENITITSPNSTMNDVRKVIKSVGLEKDINDMPMGLHTVLSEDCGTISGGQQQRILIARAIISSPKILFFDEATSALDNITQSMVCETLEAMNATRIVIAHRLSTIINCDRIIVLDGGKVVEQGTYAELMNNKGLFYNLASRQIS